MKLLKNIALVLLLPVGVLAQPGTMTEKEVKQQGKMIDASWLFVAGQYEKAEKLYTEIIDADAKNAAAHYELARTYCALKNYDKGMNSAKTASTLEPKNTWYKQLLAEILRNYGKFQDAANIYESLVKLEPENDYYYFQWADCLAQNGEKTKAIKAFDLLEKRTAFDEDLHRQKHILYLELGDTKNAEKEIQKMIDYEPTNMDFYHLLAGFYKQTNNKEKEIATYQRIVSIAPNDTKANLALAAISKTKSSDVEYLNNLKNLFQNKDINLDAKIKELIPYANKVAEKNDVAVANAAIDLIKILEQIHPNEAKVSAIYGDFLYHTNRKEEALVQYEKTVKLSGTVYSVWEQIFDILDTQKNYTKLLSMTEKALDFFPNQAAVVYYQGIAQLGLKKYNDAATAFEQASIMSGKNNALKVKSLTGIAIAQLKQQKTDAAKATLQKAQSLGAENSPQWLEACGDAAAMSNDINTALSYWQKAKEKGANATILDKKIAEKKYID